MPKLCEQDMEKGRGSVDADTFAEDEEFLNNPEPEKPTPPEDFDEGTKMCVT